MVGLLFYNQKIFHRLSIKKKSITCTACGLSILLGTGWSKYTESQEKQSVQLKYLQKLLQ
jgi:hypothetical protein